MSSVAKLVASIQKNGDRDEKPNKCGNEVYRAFHPSERYVVDFASDFASEGWAQYDTDQDAPHFGCWVNAEKMLVLTYAEGDWTLVVCPGRGGYVAELVAMNEFYRPGVIAVALDADGTKTTYRQDREEFLKSSPGE